MGKYTDVSSPRIQSLYQLRRLEFKSAGLTGTIPKEFSVLTNMGSFILDYNDLTGTLPPELSAITGVYRFEVRANFLTGTLPKEYSVWGLTEHLWFWMDFADNIFDGIVPWEYSRLAYEGDNGFASTDIDFFPQIGSLCIHRNLADYLDLSLYKISYC
eukprot:TRINITY_DN3115_c0_g1_i1.p4 TRINITY_DN3115_c0_g1~~TRINITY_DN3115_c0_g1_i1.p4  ORF type:complete len:158 (-),score=13.58 TRINITY_DN3115_c0_g1_i1:569-1042(-)